MNNQILFIISILIIFLFPGFYKRIGEKDLNKSNKYLKNGITAWFIIVLIIILGLLYSINTKITGIEKKLGIELNFNKYLED